MLLVVRVDLRPLVLILIALLAVGALLWSRVRQRSRDRRDVGQTLELVAERSAEREAFTQAILDSTAVLVVATTLQGRIISLNRAAEALSGYRSDEVAGRPVAMFVPDDEQADRRTGGPLPGGLPASEEHHWVSRDGQRYLIAWTNAVVRDAQGEPRSLVATGIDITDARRAERAARSAAFREHDRLAWDATHDALTDLHNRAGLLDRLDTMLGDAGAAPVAVLHLFLGGFRAIDEEYGHAVGDQVLRVVAKRLGDEVRGGDTVGRLGGDEFVVLCPNLPSGLAATTARRIERAVSAPLALDGRQLASGATAGVVPNLGDDAATLLDRAEAALFEAKRDRLRDAPLVPMPALDRGAAPVHPREAARLSSLRSLAWPPAGTDPFVETIVRLAARACGAPMAAVTLVDVDQQRFAATVGFEAVDVPRSAAFCAHTIVGDQVLTVEDATRDARFADSPLVTGGAHVRSYAGAPLSVGEAPPIGALCVFDVGPRRLSAAQLTALEHLRDALAAYLPELGAAGDREPGRFSS
ncbi:MAG: diguanylate cyclase [Actinobacteria bacterium]|nr:diguanylate cyclase [Actinomycetota bacterium]